MQESSVQTLNDFKTTHLLDLYTQRLRLGKINPSFDSGYFYPFDQYYLETNFVITSPNVTNSSSLPILAIGFAGYTDNLVPYVEGTPSATSFNGTVTQSWPMSVSS